MNQKNITRFDFPKEIIQELSAPGYGSCETGYWKIEGRGSDYMAATLTRMPHCRSEMVTWWFGSFLHNTQSYRLWHPDHTTFYWNENKKPGTPVGATHISEETLNGEIVPMEITFYDPYELFDQTDLEREKIHCALIAEIRKPNQSLFGMFIHIVRDTYYGCEMRNRFWLCDTTEQCAVSLIQHNLEEMGNLAEILPCLFRNENCLGTRKCKSTKDESCPSEGKG